MSRKLSRLPDWRFPMVMLRGEHSTERGEGNTEKIIMTELPRGASFLWKQPFFFAGSRKKKTCGKVEGKVSVIGNITMSSASGTKPQRIAAIDALRGFDMFFLTGGLALVVAGINLFYDQSPAWGSAPILTTIGKVA